MPDTSPERIIRDAVYHDIEDPIALEEVVPKVLDDLATAGWCIVTRDYIELAEARSQRANAAIDALTSISAGWRADWSDFDGRTLRDQLREVIDALAGRTDAQAVAEQARTFAAGKGVGPDV